MSVDGFHLEDAQAFRGYRRGAAERFYRGLQRVARKLAIEVEGVERLPAGRALLVANHAFGWDVAFAIGAIREATGRQVFVLGEHLWWKVPLLRKLAASVGTVDGTPENVDRLLEADQLVLVLPGGLREAMKPASLRYRLLWGDRYGFVRAAIRNEAPMVPLAAIGADEVFDFVGDAFERGRRWLAPLGLPVLPIPRPLHLLPWPHRVKLRYVIGEPIAPIHARSAAEDPRALRTERLLIEGALHELIDRELARREHVSMQGHGHA